MSDDLISKKAVIALIDKLGYINVSSRDDFNANRRMDKVRQEVVKLPTAFDTEKVIEELKSGTEDSRKIWHRFGDEHAIGEMSAYIRAISKKIGYPVYLDVLHNFPGYLKGTAKRDVRKIKEIMQKFEYDDDFIESVNDDFCLGWNTAKEIISKCYLIYIGRTTETKKGLNQEIRDGEVIKQTIYERRKEADS